MANLIPALREVSDHDLFVYARDRDPLVRLGLSLPLASRRDRLDALLCHFNRPPAAACPVATLVPDASFARFPAEFSRFERLYMPRTIPASMRHSAAVIVPSAFTRAEVLALFELPAERVAVAPHGVDPLFFEVPEGGPPAEPPYFAAIGSSRPRKDLVTLVRAFKGVVEAHPEIRERLVITGEDPGAGGLREAAVELRRAGRIVFTGHLDDRDLVRLYRDATALAYPSRYEGFGLPPLEAMAAGAPAAVADIPVMAEVTGEAAMRVAPADAAAWAEALRRLASDPALRDRLSSEGREHARRFTWRNSARAIVAAIEKMC